MNEAETTVPETEKTEIEPVGDGVPDVPSDGDRRSNGNGRSGTPAPTKPAGSANQAVGDGVLDVPSGSPAFVAEDHAIRAHFDRIWQQAETLAQEVPGFDLARELEDDAFAQLLSPARGLTLEQAYFVRHGRALLAAAERAAEARVSAALQASRRVPAPLGAAAATPGGFRWDAADAKTREALKARIRKGEKIYPGM